MRTAAGLLTISAAFAAAAAAQPPPQQPRIARIEATLLPGATIVGRPTAFMKLAERMAHYHVPAVSIAVIDGHRLAWSRAYGRAEAGGRTATVRTLFQAASISKPVFAAAALRLVDQGRLRLDAPINDALRSWRVPDSDVAPGSALTLRHLLSHSGGLSVHGFRGYAQREGVPTLRQLLDGAAPSNSEPIRIVQAPGQAWRYSGGGTSIAQQAVEDVTGMPVAQVVRDWLFGTAGMAESSYEQPLPPARALLAATGHLGSGEPVPGRWHVYPERAAAGLWTTPADLARFALWVMTGLRSPSAPPEHRFVAAKLIEPQAGHPPGPGERMGLGLFLAGDGPAFRFSHGGANEGFRAFLVGFPETGQGAAIMVNGDGGYPLIQEILRAVALEYGWPERFHELLVPARVDAARLAPLAGTYRWGEEEGSQVHFTVDDGQLTGQRPGDPPVRFIPMSERSFADPDRGLRLRFDGDSVVITLPEGPPITAARQASPQ
jgi:CubicO group peptidase (beta-lactamase class C family)